MPLPLEGKCIAVLETRREDQLAGMFTAKGAEIFHCPMIEIVDSPETDAVADWLRAFCDGGLDDLILLTGEGLTRLAGFARRGGMEEALMRALSAVRKITRGPKPARALTALGLAPDLAAPEPTTDGLIALLRGLNLRDRRVGVQLYDTQPNAELIDYLNAAGARVATVAPYRYAPASDDERILELIERLADGRIDALPFTSAPQVRALVECAGRHDRDERLRNGLSRTLVAAIGPVVRRELDTLGLPAHLTLEKNFFMGPLAKAVTDALADSPENP